MEFVKGDRVVFAGSEFADADTGIVTSVDGSIYKSFGYVWVKWDSNGAIQYISTDDIELESVKTQDEQQAVMLLLSLGYTITKN